VTKVVGVFVRFRAPLPCIDTTIAFYWIYKSATCAAVAYAHEILVITAMGETVDIILGEVIHVGIIEKKCR
jgi:hypothetical protein